MWRLCSNPSNGCPFYSVKSKVLPWPTSPRGLSPVAFLFRSHRGLLTFCTLTKRIPPGPCSLCWECSSLDYMVLSLPSFHSLHRYHPSPRPGCLPTQKGRTSPALPIIWLAGFSHCFLCSTFGLVSPRWTIALWEQLLWLSAHHCTRDVIGSDTSLLNNWWTVTIHSNSRRVEWPTRVLPSLRTVVSMG